MSLADDLRAAGLSVKTVTGWGARGYAWVDGQPIGIMEHHTAPPVPFPVDRLYGSLLKANINTKPDGTVWLIASKACNYSSGSGSSTVLAEVRAGTPPTKNAIDRGLSDDVNGNPYFFNNEVDHPGDGSPIPQVQHDAVVTATAVVLGYYGLTSGNVISHAEWTRRKSDPYWNGDRRCIETIRSELETPMKIPLESWAVDAFTWAVANKVYTEQTDLSKIREPYEFQQLMVALWRTAFGGKGHFPVDDGVGVHDHDGRYVRDVKITK